MMLLGIAGYAGAGKSLLARLLKEEHQDVLVVAFADPLKRLVGDLYDWPVEKFEDREWKERPDRRYVRLDRAACAGFDDVVDRWHDGVYGDVPLHVALGLTPEECADWVETCEVHLTPRFALQRFGTDAGRVCCPDTWLHRLMREHPKTDIRHLILSDIRFQNEVDLVLHAGGEVVRVARAGCGAGNHASESAHLLSGVIDIRNDGSVEDLRAVARALLR